jgi:serine protein kinase
MPKEYFQKIIEEQRKEGKKIQWEGTCLDYLALVKHNPAVAQLAPGRIYNMVMLEGTEPIKEATKIPDYEDMVGYKFFSDELFGLEEPLHDIMRFFKAGARRTETGKRILILVGPVSSGKSTIATMLKRGLEQDPTPIYAIKGCPMHEEPLHLIPMDQRPRWEEILGVKIEGDLCPMCRFNLVENDRYRDERGHVLWEQFPVVALKLNERARIGIGTFQPSDPKNQDVSELIGRVDLSKITRYGETDPRAYNLDGELEIANRGLVEYIEILKCDIKFHYILITVAQEQLVKHPASHRFMWMRSFCPTPIRQNSTSSRPRKKMKPFMTGCTPFSCLTTSGSRKKKRSTTSSLSGANFAAYTSPRIHSAFSLNSPCSPV